MQTAPLPPVQTVLPPSTGKSLLDLFAQAAISSTDASSAAQTVPLAGLFAKAGTFIPPFYNLVKHFFCELDRGYHLLLSCMFSPRPFNLFFTLYYHTDAFAFRGLDAC